MAKETTSDDWTKVLMNHLKSLRSDPAHQKKRGKRLTLEAGSNISPDKLENLKSTRSRKNVEPRESPTDSAALEVLAPQACHSGNTAFQEDLHVDEGDFLLCRFETEHDMKERRFVGRVTDIDGQKIEIKSLRFRLGSKRDYFFYPQVPDVVSVAKTDILRKLYSVPERRGRIVFRDFDPRRAGL